MVDFYTPSRRRFLTASSGLLFASSGLTIVRAQELKEITFALSSNSFSVVLLRIAERRGMFEKHGIKPKIITLDSANASFSAMIGGSAQVASAGLLDALAAKARGQDTIAVANMYRGQSSVILLAKSVAEKSGVKPDAPVAERLKVLDGLSLAGPSATSGYTTSIDLSAQAVGAKMKLVYMAQGAMPAALEAGAVQAVAAGTPYWITPVTRGTAVVWIKVSGGELPNESVPTTSGTLLMSKSYARANPDVIVKIQNAIKDAGAFVTNEKEATLKELAAIYPELDAQTIQLGFNAEWQNWTRSVVTEDDVRHDIAIMKRLGQAPAGIETIDPKSMLDPRL